MNMSANAPAASRVQKDTIMQLSYYEIFSLDPTTTSIDVSAVHRAYRRFSLLFHPDKDPSPAAREAFERIKLAAETLTDPQCRREYDESLKAAHRAPSSSDGQQQQRQAEMEEEARAADAILRRREAESAVRAAARRRDEEERTAAARQMLHELTSMLTTPFRQMEAVLVHEWDIDEDLLQMKEKEVEKLLQKLRTYDKRHVKEQKRMFAEKRERETA